MGRSINPVADLRAYFELKSAIREYQPDIVHSHTFKAGLLARLIPGSHKRVHTFHGHLFDDQSFSSLQKFVITCAERFNARRSDLLISVGSKVGVELRAAGIGTHKPWLSIAPGVEPLATTSYNGGFVVGWMARVTSVKNPMLAVEVARFFAFHQLRDGWWWRSLGSGSSSGASQPQRYRVGRCNTVLVFGLSCSQHLR